MKTENHEPLAKEYEEMMENPPPQLLEEDGDFFPENDSSEELLDDQEILEGVSTEDPVRMYLKEMGSFALLSPEEETDSRLEDLVEDEFAPAPEETAVYDLQKEELDKVLDDTLTEREGCHPPPLWVCR